jgi:hypothetical protein
VNQISGATPAETPTQAQEESPPPADLAAVEEPAGFGARGRVRRRARFLRKARELAYRDLGGLVYNLHRFGQRNDALVLAKLTTVGQIDGELRTLEAALQRREPVTVLREAGISACPRCAAIHSSEDRFCPNCGMAMDRGTDLPIASAQAVAPVHTPASPASASPTPTQATATAVLTSKPSVSAPTAQFATIPAPEVPAAVEPAAHAEPVAAPQVERTDKEESTEILKPQTPGP